MPSPVSESLPSAGAPAGSAAAVSPVCAVVLVCWNNRDYLRPCLASLYASGMRHACEVVVVDNGSTDGSQAMLGDRFPDVAIIQNDRNVGLGRASNQGIMATSAPYVLLLNNDTLVEGAAIDALIDVMAATPDAGAVGGTLLNGDGTFQSAHGSFPTLVEELLIATRIGEWLRPGYPCHRAGDAIAPVDWLSSACLLLRRSALGEVGLLDEEYFIYGDETDLQYRLVQHGWKVYHVPASTTVHFGGRSLDRWRRRRMVYRGKMLFFKKNYGPVRHYALRAMLGGLTAAKLAVWSLAWPVPSVRERAARELRSNLDVLRLCTRLE
jgi:GT2 family glycosyltransferase